MREVRRSIRLSSKFFFWSSLVFVLFILQTQTLRILQSVSSASKIRFVVFLLKRLHSDTFRISNSPMRAVTFGSIAFNFQSRPLHCCFNFQSRKNRLLGPLHIYGFYGCYAIPLLSSSNSSLRLISRWAQLRVLCSCSEFKVCLKLSLTFYVSHGSSRSYIVKKTHGTLNKRHSSAFFLGSTWIRSPVRVLIPTEMPKSPMPLLFGYYTLITIPTIRTDR